MKTKEKSTAELRSFGLIMALIFAVIGAWTLWRGRPIAWPLITVAGIFTAFAVLAPTALRLVDRYWTILGEKIGSVVTLVLMSGMFFFVITPLGLLLRLFGKDLLQLKLEPEADSYWSPAEIDGPASRPYLPY